MCLASVGSPTVCGGSPWLFYDLNENDVQKPYGDEPIMRESAHTRTKIDMYCTGPLFIDVYTLFYLGGCVYWHLLSLIYLPTCTVHEASPLVV